MIDNYALQLRTLVAPWCSIHHCDMSCLEARGHLVELSRINAQTHRLASDTVGSLYDTLKLE